MDAEEVIDHIWTNWKNNQGACQDCPARDNHGGWPLYYGQGSLSTDLMLIGEEPGGANDPNYDDSKGYAPREKRDYPEERWATVDEHHPRSGPSEISIVESSRIDPVLFKHIEGYTNDSSDSNSTPYYTNTKKSQEIRGQDFGTSDPPVQRCLPYLDLEVNAIDPKVIVLIGDDATKNFADRFPINVSETTYDDIFEILCLTEGPPYIVRSYNWGGKYGMPLEHLSVSSEKEYWEELGKTINKALKQ